MLYSIIKGFKSPKAQTIGNLKPFSSFADYFEKVANASKQLFKVGFKQC